MRNESGIAEYLGGELQLFEFIHFIASVEDEVGNPVCIQTMNNFSDFLFHVQVN